MLISTTTYSPAHGFQRHDYEVTSARNVLGFWLASRCCAGDDMCLIDPPTWMWNLGLPPVRHRISVGALVWRLGQWAHGLDQAGGIKLKGQLHLGNKPITRDEAIHLGWDAANMSDLDRLDQ